MKISNINEFLSKYVNNKSLYIIIIIGITFMLLPGIGSTKKEPLSTPVYEEYSDEERLSKILSDVSGAGKVSVMITYYGSSSFDIAFEEKTEEGSAESSAVSDNGSPFIKGKTYPAVKGVIAVAEGAYDEAVKLNLTKAISSALGIPSYKVCVLEGKERK